MKYELAKELKDAGFPQKGNGTTRLQGSAFSGGLHHCYIPTLSELIGACGENFHELHHCRFGLNEDEKWKWEVWAHEPHRQSFGGIQGATPEEAIARLWLALNKKV